MKVKYLKLIIDNNQRYLKEPIEYYSSIYEKQVELERKKRMTSKKQIEDLGAIFSIKTIPENTFIQYFTPFIGSTDGLYTTDVHIMNGMIWNKKPYYAKISRPCLYKGDYNEKLYVVQNQAGTPGINVVSVLAFNVVIQPKYKIDEWILYNGTKFRITHIDIDCDGVYKYSYISEYKTEAMSGVFESLIKPYKETTSIIGIAGEDLKSGGTCYRDDKGYIWNGTPTYIGMDIGNKPSTSSVCVLCPSSL